MAMRLGLLWRDKGQHEEVDQVRSRLVPGRDAYLANEMIVGRYHGWDVRLVDVSGLGPMKNFGRISYGSDVHGGVHVRVTIVLVRLAAPVRPLTLVPRQWDGPNIELHFAKPTGQEWVDAVFECDAIAPETATAVADPAFAYALSQLPTGSGVELADQELRAAHGKLSLDEQEAFLHAAVSLAAAVPDALRAGG